MRHVAIDKWKVLPVTSSEWQACNMYEGLVRFCVPLFLMISGALLLRPDKDLPLKRLYGKNILRLVTAFVFWSVVYIGLTILFMPKATADVGAFVTKCARGLYHLWFLYMMVGLYIIIPFLKKIVADKKMTEYFLLLTLIFASVMPSLKGIPLLTVPLTAALNSMSPYFLTGYTFYFVAGYYLHTYGLSRGKKYVIYLLGAAGILLGIMLTSYMSARKGMAEEWWYSYMRPVTVMASLAVFLFLRDNVSKLHFTEKTANRFQLMTKWNFGVYLVHGLFLVLVYKVDHAVTSHIHPVITVPLYTAVVLIFSYIASAALHRIPVLNRYIV